MEEASKYPLDFEALSKGDDISMERLTTIIEHPPASKEFDFGVLKLRERIVDELSERGLEVVVVQQNGGLRILTDAEASTYCYREVQRGLKIMGRNLKRQIVIDQTALNKDEHRLHESRLMVTSRMYQAASAARKESTALPEGRPFMPSMLPERTGADHQKAAGDTEGSGL